MVVSVGRQSRDRESQRREYEASEGWGRLAFPYTLVAVEHPR